MISLKYTCHWNLSIMVHYLDNICQWNPLVRFKLFWKCQKPDIIYYKPLLLINIHLHICSHELITDVILQFFFIDKKWMKYHLIIIYEMVSVLEDLINTDFRNKYFILEKTTVGVFKIFVFIFNLLVFNLDSFKYCISSTQLF